MKKMLIGAVVFTLFGATGAAAQDVPSVWDSPSFMGPHPGSDLGAYLVDGEGADFGIHGIWRMDQSFNLGIRVGYLDTPGDGVLLFGAETWGNIHEANESFPLDLAWTAGAGAWLNGSTVVSVPVGVSLGRTVDIDNSVSLQIYGHPRLGLVLFENVNDDLELDLEGQFDIGTDIYLSPDLTLRVGASLGNFDALGIGLALRQ